MWYAIANFKEFWRLIINNIFYFLAMSASSNRVKSLVDRRTDIIVFESMDSTSGYGEPRITRQTYWLVDPQSI